MKGLDTTFLIHLLRKEPQATLKALELDREPLVYTTEVNVYELISGIKSANKEHEIRNTEILLSRLVVLPLDRKASIKAGLISSELMEKGKMIDDIDCLTAGILLSNGCDTIVTRNVKHFERIDDIKIESY